MKWRLTIVGLAICIGLIGCSKKEVEEEQAVDPPVEDENKVFPLTGMQADKSADQRITSVMVNNHAAARPQSGLSEADIVFEILAEGAITRFLALYQSETPEIVGPVRSAREYYFDLATGYDALYVYHGAAGFVEQMIQDRDIENLNGFFHDDDRKLFKRDTSRKAPHNSYLLFRAVNEVAKSKGYDILSTYDALPFLETNAAPAGENATDIEITYPGRKAKNTVEYTYDSKSETYTRFEDQEKTVDRESKEALQIDNLFIVEASHQVIDDEGRRDIDLDTGGTAYLIQKGVIQYVEWENRDGRIIPVENGEPIGFVEGKTWINVVPSNPGIAASVTVTE